VVDFSHNELTGGVPSELGRLSFLSIQLQDNKIREIDPELCHVDGLNDFDVLSFGCDGVLCPVGTWNVIGRQAHAELPCKSCGKAEYMGSTKCGQAGASETVETVLRGLFAVALFSWMLL
jgi:hypothetical protein